MEPCVDNGRPDYSQGFVNNLDPSPKFIKNKSSINPVIVQISQTLGDNNYFHRRLMREPNKMDAPMRRTNSCEKIHGVLRGKKKVEEEEEEEKTKRSKTKHVSGSPAALHFGCHFYRIILL